MPAEATVWAADGPVTPSRRHHDRAIMTETSIAESRTADAGVAARYQEPSSAWRWVAHVAVLLPIVVAVVRALVNGWFPVGDAALLAIRAYDVGTPDHPLLGSWTSASFALGIDVNNPGPLYPDLLAPFMWTIGRAFGIGTATAIGVGTINAAAALGTMGPEGKAAIPALSEAQAMAKGAAKDEKDKQALGKAAGGSIKLLRAQ